MEILHISDARQEELCKATAEKHTLQRLTVTIRHGWPKAPKSCAPETRSYLTFRDELTVNNRIVMKGHKSMIPKSLQDSYTPILQKGHPGLEVHDIVFWTTMSDYAHMTFQIYHRQLLPQIYLSGTISTIWLYSIRTQDGLR